MFEEGVSSLMNKKEALVKVKQFLSLMKQSAGLLLYRPDTMQIFILPRVATKAAGRIEVESRLGVGTEF